MKYLVTLISAMTLSVSAFAQVSIPFDVPLPSWKVLVTPNKEGQLFQTSDLKSDLLMRIDGPEFDDYAWHTQSACALDEGETTMVLQPGTFIPVISGEDDDMVELEFDTYASGIFTGYSQNYGLQKVEAKPIALKDLEECTYVVCLPDAEGNIYVILERGTEEHFGWADTFYIGRLKNGYVIFPYVCTVERNLESNHSGILNGKLGNCDLSKFTLRDAEYILKHAKPIEDKTYAVMYAYNADEGKQLAWFETRLIGERADGHAPANDNQIYTNIEQEPTYPGGTAALLTNIAKKVRYPAIAMENNIQGKVVVRFIVEKDGSITNAEVIKSVNADLDREALRVVKSLGKMSSPGKINGRAVRSYYSVPINFKM